MEEPFTLIEETTEAGPHHLFEDVVQLKSGKSADHDLPYIAGLRATNPDMIVTAIPSENAPLQAFAAAGYAGCERDLKTDSFASWRGYAEPARRSDKVTLAESVSFAKYHYTWNSEDFILYTVGRVQYVLKERRDSESVLGPSALVDKLILAIGEWISSINDVVWVYDGYWQTSNELFKEVQKASWDNVILDEAMKKELTSVTHRFFDSKDAYEDLGVPWKRGLLFHGPPGNGKTISIRALMHSLYERDDPVPTLYVKSAPYTFDIEQVFSRARALAPCMLILEDVETIVTSDTRSYFFNEMDGLANNDGLFIVASTNFLDRLDTGLSKRPSRFDRKYLFPIPNEHERTLYCEFWRNKLKSNKKVEFPAKLCPPMAHITTRFSFAFLQECFVATLLQLVRDRDAELTQTSRPFDDDNDDLDDYELWRAFKKEAKILRKEVESHDDEEGEESLTRLPTKSHTPSRSAERSGSSRRQHESGTGSSLGSGALSNRVATLRLRNELLPELAWYEQKRELFNSRAFEMK